ncbi:nudix hydrolase-like protein [Mortierella claussenii]|nr:nudix hydrolase-like protein [Mortierella claussenii]
MTTNAVSALDRPLQDIKLTGIEKRGSGRWLSLHQVNFIDPAGNERSWEVCHRTSAVGHSSNNSAPSIDAVDVIPIIKTRLDQEPGQSKATHVALVVQYRPAMGTYTIEFPSGLIDTNESPSEAALRELGEEVGYSQKNGHAVQVVKTLDAVAYEPGMTNSCSRMVIIEVTLEQDEIIGTRSTRKPRLEDDEWSLQVVIQPLKGLFKSLQELQSSAGGPSKLVLDSRLYAWALGRELQY